MKFNVYASPASSAADGLAVVVAAGVTQPSATSTASSGDHRVVLGAPAGIRVALGAGPNDDVPVWTKIG